MKNFVFYALTILLVTRPGPTDPIMIVRGEDPSQFEQVGLGPDSIAIMGGEVRLTGKPLGYFATKDEYRDYILSFEWKYDRPVDPQTNTGFRENSGLLLHVRSPHKVWPDCFQVQLAQADPGAIFGMGDSQLVGVVDSVAQSHAIRPVGQWNRIEVTCQAGKISCILNGIEVARGKDLRPDRGAIGWQSEGVPVRFRDIRLQPLP